MIRAIKDLVRFIEIVEKNEGVAKRRLLFGYILDFLFYGFTVRQYIALGIYKKKHAQKITYVNYWRAKRIEKWFNDSIEAEWLNDKRVFNQKFDKYVKRDWLYVDDASDEEISAFLSNHSKSLLKPSNSSSGKGIRLAQTVGDCRGGHGNLLEEKISNHETIRMFSEQSLNTVRVYTLIDTDRRVLFLSSSLRVGASGSIVDNMHGNGHAVPIDIETGILLGNGKSYDSTRFDINPHSGLEYKGIQLPYWDKVIECVLYACNELKEVRFNAWDIAITDTGVELIEGNVEPDPTLMQLFLKEGNYSVFRSVHKRQEKERV